MVIMVCGMGLCCSLHALSTSGNQLLRILPSYAHKTREGVRSSDTHTHTRTIHHHMPAHHCRSRKRMRSRDVLVGWGKSAMVLWCRALGGHHGRRQRAIGVEEGWVPPLTGLVVCGIFDAILLAGVED
ncbi:hypothetical protein B0T18DRAFT_398492 [Schizothecium vesticola]|uniref:Secreted protein n=1 Tax=Schizothecium vesticola TaxID=314040 RepID=A0AA40FA85_9PEZI|nr:hypothetical protein B0T18DRAFT_398492 [Schizothecium vesticola]